MYEKRRSVIGVAEPTGSETFVTTRISGVELCGADEADAEVVTGSNVEFDFNMEKAAVFDPKTELRIVLGPDVA